MEGQEPLDHVYAGWNLLCLPWIDQRGVTVGYGIVVADALGGMYRNSIGVPDWMHGQPVAGMGRVGLQWFAGKHPWPDIATVFCIVAAGKPNWHRAGRLAQTFMV